MKRDKLQVLRNWELRLPEGEILLVKSLASLLSGYKGMGPIDVPVDTDVRSIRCRCSIERASRVTITVSVNARYADSAENHEKAIGKGEGDVSVA